MDRFLKDLYSMAGHWATTACPVINDEISYKMIEKPEYPLCRQLSESVGELLADRLFLHSTWQPAQRAGAIQFVMVHGGYDTYFIRHSLWYGGVHTFDINPQHVVKDKSDRLEKAGITKLSKACAIACDYPGNVASVLEDHPRFDRDKITFIHLGALPCELNRESFEQLMTELFKIIPPASSVTFSYKNSAYSYSQMEKLLSQAGFHIYEHQTAADLHRDYIRNFELLNNRSFPLSDDLRYCLAVKKIRVCDSIALNKRC
ncbi:MAG: class I SAM-dependent methyltransferase [Oscillospiraceae bacterium]|nr:class I SAM-dependent methyltransferase [Oscillospiraceae bacterium]